MESYIISKEENGILLFTINRPEKRNAINFDVMTGLEKALDIAMDPDVRVFAIQGTGDRAFCSGGDLSAFHSLKTKEQAYGMLSRMAAILYRLLVFPKPTIAILNGNAVGGGCEIAAACDFRIGRSGLIAGFVQGNLAITTGWGGGTILIEKLPQQTAFKLLLDASLHSAEELKDYGFLDAVFEGDAHEACLSFLSKVIEKERPVLQAYKTLLNSKWQMRSMKERMEAEAAACSVLWEDEAHHRKVEDFMKRNK